MSFVGQSLHPSVITGGWRIITEQLEIRSVNKKENQFFDSRSYTVHWGNQRVCTF